MERLKDGKIGKMKDCRMVIMKDWKIAWLEDGQDECWKEWWMDRMTDALNDRMEIESLD